MRKQQDHVKCIPLTIYNEASTFKGYKWMLFSLWILAFQILHKHHIAFLKLQCITNYQMNKRILYTPWHFHLSVPV